MAANDHVSNNMIYTVMTWDCLMVWLRVGYVAKWY